MDLIFARRAFRPMARMAIVAMVLALAVSSEPGLSLGSALNEPAPPQKIEAVPGEYVVQLRSDSEALDEAALGSESLELLGKKLNAVVVERIRPDMVLVRDPKGSATFAESLAESPWVSRIEPNYIYRNSKLPDDPGLSQTWGLKNTGAADSEGKIGVAGIDVGAEAAWDLSTGSKAVVVAVIDTGIDFSHPDLKEQAWVNEKERAGSPGVDDDGNGLVDDVHGYDFANDKGDSSDDNGHGSHCAGTIGAKGDDGQGLVGVSWNVSLMAIKFLDKSGSGTLANAIKSIDYARTMGAQIMSNSWGGGGVSELMKTAIEDADKAGVLFVVAAGNNANDNDVIPTYPASYDVPNVLSVAAIDNRGALAVFSNYGFKSVHVAAPGVNIISTVPGGKYDSYSGTSMATPHVAGIAALIRATDETLTHYEIREKIISSARPLYTLKSKVSSGGIADAYYSLSGVTPPVDPNDPSLLPNVEPYSFSSDHPYKEGTRIERKIEIPGAKKMAIRFSKFETEPSYDTVAFYDGSGKFVGALSGTQAPGSTSPLIIGESVTLKFSSDETVNGYGFDVEAVLFE